MDTTVSDVPTGRVPGVIPVFANLNVCCQINLKPLIMSAPSDDQSDNYSFIAYGMLDRSWLASTDLRRCRKKCVSHRDALSAMWHCQSSTYTVTRHPCDKALLLFHIY